MFSADQGVTPTSVVAEAIDFDGTNDYVSRASDLTGNTDGKTFTFSCWVWFGDSVPTGTQTIYSVENTGLATTGRFQVYLTTSGGFGKVTVLGLQAGTASSQGLNISSSTFSVSGNTFYNILISNDAVDSATNFRLYVNDVVQSLSYTVTVNANIDFAGGLPRIGYGTAAGPNIFKGRLSNVFLDYTYRDLSITANRRLFVTADLKPASGQAALNPILYLPMNDPTAPGTNAGTGGNFTLTGTVARSGRGPNQYNAPYSTFDGSADYLSRTTAPTGAANSTQFTFAYNIQRIGTTERVLVITSNLIGNQVWFNLNFTASTLTVNASNSSNTLVLNMTYSPAGGFVVGRNYNVVISLDLASTSTRHVFVNGVDVTSSVGFPTYTNSAIGFGSTTYWSVASRVNLDFPSGNGTSNAYFGALWFNTSYIDLSVASNLAKFVTGTGIDAKPVDLGASGELPTGTSPLIYLPMYGNNAGKNYGTGGDFTVNSGPYTGARGPNEFWGNKADFNGTTGYLSRTSALAGVSDGGKISGSFYIRRDAAQDGFVLAIRGSGDGVQGLEIFVNNAGALSMYSRTSAPVTVLDLDIGSALPSIGVDYCVQFCFDFSNTSKRFVYVNGVQVTPTYNTYTNGNGYFSAPTVTVGARSFSGGYQTFLNGVLSELYFVTDYIDFSLESNRLKFRDAFGNPVDLTPQITANSIPNPAIYMRFPPTSFGTNSGTGGNFTVNGTITDGGQL